MPSESLPSPSVVAQVANAQVTDIQTIKEFFDQFKALSSTGGLNAISTVCDDNTKLQRQLQSKDDELAKLKKEIGEQEQNKDTAINEMFRANEKEKSKHDKTLEQVQALQTTAEEKEKTFAEQEKTVHDLESKVKKLQTDYESQTAGLTQAQTDIGILQQNLKEKEVIIDKMRKAGSELKQSLYSTKKNVKELEEQKSSLEESLQVDQARLGKLEAFAAECHEGDEDFMMDGFTNLWDYATTEMYSYLKEDLPNEVLQNRPVWDDFKKQTDLALRHRVSLPCSNSTAAKYMRLVVILAILAREIDKHIFQPTYIVPEDTQIREVLVKLAASDSEKELFCRSMLLSIDPDAQSEARRSRIQAVVRNVSWHLYKLFSETEYNGIRLSVEKVAQRATDIWKPIQQAKQKYEPDFEPAKWGDDQWSPFVFPDNGLAENQTSDEASDDDLLTVFPRISVVEKNLRYPLSFVIQVRRSLLQCAAAEREIAQKPTSPTIGRMTSNRSRKKSTTPGREDHPNGNFLGQKTRGV